MSDYKYELAIFKDQKFHSITCHKTSHERSDWAGGIQAGAYLLGGLEGLRSIEFVHLPEELVDGKPSDRIEELWKDAEIQKMMEMYNG